MSKKDVWAVGGSQGHPLIGHWDGKAWTRTPSPAVAGGLNAVSADSATDAWAVGSTGNGALIEHWNGTSWTVAYPSPSVHGQVIGLPLISVSAVAPDDVWVVGPSFCCDRVWHWDGMSWTSVATADPGGEDYYLTAVSAVSANSAWLVGYYEDTVYDEDCHFNVVEHWDGTQWTVESTPKRGCNWDEFNAVDAVSDTAAVVAGSYEYDYYQYELLGTCDTKACTLSDGRHPAEDNNLYGVSALSTSDVWAVGYAYPDALIEHNDDYWVIDGQTRGQEANLYGVSALSDSNVWAVGGDYPDVILLEHWNGSTWTSKSMTE